MLKPWYDLRSALCREYGEALLLWSELATGSPVGIEYEVWVETLRKHGQALLNFVATDDIGEVDDKTLEAAQEAFLWTADNILHLWD